MSEWGHEQSAAVQHLARLGGVSAAEAQKLMQSLWEAIRDYDNGRPAASRLLLRAPRLNNAFRLNPECVRVNLASDAEVWECDTCARICLVNVRGLCFNSRCRGRLIHADINGLAENHYRILYEQSALPPQFRAEEHTAQIDTEKAKELQDEFKAGGVHLLSSSTTFEVGVDLGDLDVAFLRNIPPETFNYAQRVGRTGRRDRTGFAISYCRRNPHDLYHFEEPVQRVMSGVTRPPLMRLENEKIILRHMASLVFGQFFKSGSNHERFQDVEAFIGENCADALAHEMHEFCEANLPLEQALKEVVPVEMRASLGLDDGTWIGMLFGRAAGFMEALRPSLKT